MNKPITTQYTVEFPDQPAVHAQLTRVLVKENIPFHSMLTTRVGDKASIRFLAPKDDSLRDRLAGLGIAVREEAILRLELANNHRGLQMLAKTLAEKDIKILSLYSSVEGEKMRIVLTVDHPASAAALIETLGFNTEHSIYD